MGQGRPGYDAMNYKLASAALLRADCGQVEQHQNAPRGMTKLTTSAEIALDDATRKALQVIVTVRLAGLPADATQDDEEAFWAECRYRHIATFESDITEEQISPEMANSLAAPLYYTALNHCQQLVWNMGFSGVRPPLKDPPTFSEANLAEPRVQPSRKKRSRKKPEQSDS